MLGGFCITRYGRTLTLLLEFCDFLQAHAFTILLEVCDTFLFPLALKSIAHE